MSSIIANIILFGVFNLVHAFVLKLYMDSGVFEEQKKSFGTALKVTGGVALASTLLGFIPWVGWLLGPFVWFGAVMGIYKVKFTKALGLFFIQLGISAVLTVIAFIIMLAAGISMF